VIREELRELEQAEEAIIRQVAHSAGHALNWIIAGATAKARTA
jgi:hypothetical protein